MSEQPPKRKREEEHEGPGKKLKPESVSAPPQAAVLNDRLAQAVQVNDIMNTNIATAA